VDLESIYRDLPRGEISGMSGPAASFAVNLLEVNLGRLRDEIK